MADTKVSDLTDGAPALTGDAFHVARSGTDRKLTVSDVDTYVAANSLATHAADTTSVHGIADTSVLATATSVATAVSNHEADTTSVHGIADTSVLATATSVATAVSNHEADTTNVHGIADTSVLATATSVATAVSNHAALTSSVHGITAAAATVLDDTTVGAMLTTLGGQPLDSDLTAIAALAPTNDDIIQRKAGAWTNRALAQLLTDLGLGAIYQPLDSDLTAVAALTPTNDDLIQRKAGAWTNRTMAQLIADLAALGTTFQPLDGELTALAGLTSAADKLPYFTGSGTAGLADLSSFIRTVLDDASAAAARTTLGAGDVVGPSSSVNAEIALFDSTTGKLIKRASTTGLLKAASGVIAAAVAGTDYSRYEGLEWAALVSTSAIDSARRYYEGVAVTSTHVFTANRLYLHSFYAPYLGSLYSLSVYVTTGVGSAKVRVGLYASGSDGLPSGAPVAESGDLDGDGTPAHAEYVLGTPLALTPGKLYWLAVVSDSAITVAGTLAATAALAGNTAIGRTSANLAAPTTPQKGIYKSLTYGSLPSSPNSGFTSEATVPAVFSSFV